MSGIELKRYTTTQVRIIRGYQRHVHPELQLNNATMMWISRYAAMFQEWWKLNAC